MFKLKMSTVDGEIINVPFLMCKWQADWNNNQIKYFPFELYDSYINEKWIPEIPLEDLPLNSNVTKQYITEKNDFILKLSYYKKQSDRYPTQYVSVSIQLYKGTSYITSGIQYMYPYAHQDISFMSSIFTYDPINKIVGEVEGQRREISNILFIQGQDYCTLGDIQYYKWTNITYSILKGTYTSDRYYWNGMTNPNGYTKVYATDSGKPNYSTFYAPRYYQQNGNTLRDKTLDAWNAIFENITIPSYPDQNPDDDQTNGQDTPDLPIPGDGDTSSDPIPDPPAKPLFDVTNTGFVVIYNPSVTDIRSLAYFMWSGDFTDLIKKMFASPFESIISLKMLFCPVTTGASQTVWLGNVETDVS